MAGNQITTESAFARRKDGETGFYRLELLSAYGGSMQVLRAGRHQFVFRKPKGGSRFTLWIPKSVYEADKGRLAEDLAAKKSARGFAVYVDDFDQPRAAIFGAGRQASTPQPAQPAPASPQPPPSPEIPPDDVLADAAKQVLAGKRRRKRIDD